jgi:hypothetical protein
VVATAADARKQKMGEAEARALLKKADVLYAAKGKKVVRVEVSKSSVDAVALMMGPTGNLRAPTLVVGRTLLVGFDADTYAEVLR